jgi:DNA-directed RNA polymerase specialized sigma24 family protein
MSWTMNNAVNTYKLIRRDYEYSPDVMSEEDERTTRIKEIIHKHLNTADRTIILLYIDLQSYRKLGVMLGLSHMTVRREVIRIKNEIMKHYNGVS